MRKAYRSRAWYQNKKTVFSGLTIVIILAAALVIRSLGGSAAGTIDNSANLATNPTAAAPKQVKVSGHNISFTYPDNFRVTPSQAPMAPQLENFNFVTKNSPFWQLAIGVNSLPSGKLADDASFSARAKNPSQYKQESWLINGQSVSVFSDTTQNYSKVAFIPHAGKEASVALSGDGDAAQMQTAEQAIIKSLEWQ